MNKSAIAIVVGIVVLGGWFVFGGKDSAQNSVSQIGSEEIEIAQSSVDAKFGKGHKITVYKSPTCGCCGGYEKALREWGFEVESVPVDDVSSIKSKYDIPADKQSCHTMTWGKYFLEGHVPMEALAKLIADKPEIDGIGLPGMPSGTPGMPGKQSATYEVYQVVGGEYLPYINIQTDGTIKDFAQNKSAGDVKNEQGFYQIDTKRLSEMLTAKDFKLIDVHTPEQEHITGTDAVIPFDKIDKIAQKIGEDKDAKVVLYCRSGSMSAQASAELAKRGYTNIYDLSGGLNAWKAANKDVLSIGSVE